MSSGIQSKTNLLLYVFALLGIITAIYGVFSALFGVGLITPAYAQQDPFLAQRINQIEQRFTLIESRLNQIEQQSRYSQLTSPNVNNLQDTELRLIHSQLDTLQLRLEETECGLLRLDERTLSNTARQARKSANSVASSDICRETPNVPLQLSARP